MAVMVLGLCPAILAQDSFVFPIEGERARVTFVQGEVRRLKASEESWTALPLGASCRRGEECASQTCNWEDGTCVACRPQGHACSLLDERCDGFCSRSSGTCEPCIERGWDGCVSDTDCCEGRCDPLTSRCVSCRFEGEACTVDSDCCFGDCSSELQCERLDLCGLTDEACERDMDCCSWSCVPETQRCECKRAGQVCRGSHDCCPGTVCSPSGLCEGGYSPTCVKMYSECRVDDECCSGVCIGKETGYCL